MVGCPKRLAVVLAFALCSAFIARAQDGTNARAIEDTKAFIAKFEEGDSLFNDKKYAEAATVLAAAHELYLRAQRRDPEAGRYDVSLKAGRFPALRYYGYGFGSNASLGEDAAGAVKGTSAGLHVAETIMWMDAAILSGADKFPFSGGSDEPPMQDMSEETLDRTVSDAAEPVYRLKLPVPDREWRDVVLWSRRAQLLIDFALQKYPQWKTGTPDWAQYNFDSKHTGNDALAVVKAKLAKGEPEYAKVVADAKNAAPRGAEDWIGYKIEDLDKAIASVKQDGWIEWNMARDLYITKDYTSQIRSSVAKMYAAEGKQMPSDALKPLEEKAAELKSAMEQSAAKRKFPTGKPHNPTIEAKAAASIKARFPGATILKTSLDSSDWTITKNELDIPKYRSMGVLVLAQIPGQKLPWLFFGYLRQSYAGGGTYSSGGTFGEPSDIRLQAG